MADDSYVAVHDGSSCNVTLKKRTTESIGGGVYEVKDKMNLAEIINHNNLSIKTIIVDESFKTFTPTTRNKFFMLSLSWKQYKAWSKWHQGHMGRLTTAHLPQ